MSQPNGEVTAKQKESSAANVDDQPVDDLQQFDNLFNVLLKDLDELEGGSAEISGSLEWFRQVNTYNVPFGKKNRGLTVVHSYRFLLGDQRTVEGEKLAMVLGWCIEWLQAFFLVADDIMDNSVTRRGKSCWYRQPHVGLKAINDAYYMESAVYFMLRKYFRHLPYYVDIVDLFHETILQTITGQNLDLITASADRVDFTPFTIERYNAIVKYKTGFYSFYLPVACAMHMAGVSDADSYRRAKEILLKMGEYFQIQDDFLDCYGDPQVTGKIGTDIEDNKCSWLIVQALGRATDEQRATLQEHYARHDPVSVANVKAIYADLKLQQAYSEYEENSYQSLMEMINSLTGNLPRGMFVSYAQKIYRRSK